MRKTQRWESALGTGDGEALVWNLNGPSPVLYAVAGYFRFAVKTLAGSVRIKASLEGGPAPAWDQQLVLAEEPTLSSDTPAAQEGTLVGKTTAGVLAWFSGDYKALRVEQVGATPAQVTIVGAADDY